ncbi:cdp-diacylglycerol-serine O-phosphatidyltransferase-like protein [Mycotypha africana]|uniref:cdp-diacylglycerol-serine O-phosphatidyltransferase-like protein n=1 Tax=Mycotypha africana TaxID=64632 RepID=UPI002301C131|nr:cdp-diacylglycerol-serine O-phosphatidyltransferase-like protein [Mycotypha africana]KAI8981932.1 cdp-diacylglycerol-serine O-phosphatidyltransferase-like protein [Mycotypha africana]
MTSATSEKDKVKLSQVDSSNPSETPVVVGHFSMVRNFYLADIITLMNGVCGIQSVLFSMRYLTTHNERDLWTSMYFMPFGMFFDFMDGRVARWRNNSSLLGQELDSLADLISFGVAPAALAYAVGMRTVLDTFALTYFVCCGIARLARYNATVALAPKDATGKVHYFEGTPIPTSLALVGIIAYYVCHGQILDALPGQLIKITTDWDLHPFVLLYVLSGTLMISKTLHIPKP